MATSNILDNIESQLAEVELLQSMYPAEKEFKLNDVTVLEDLRDWLSKDGENGQPPPNSISFVLRLDEKIDIYVRFPHEYPSEKSAEIFVR